LKIVHNQAKLYGQWYTVARFRLTMPSGPGFCAPLYPLCVTTRWCALMA